MHELIWINGEVMPLADARVGVEDRGFQFADGVYEAIRLYNRRPFALWQHLDRLELSCAGISLSLPIEQDELADEILRLSERADIVDGLLYLQVTRGAAPRNHLFPANIKPTLLFYIRPIAPVAPIASGPGQSLLSVPDERWKRCWVKSISLLANVLAKNAANAEGADEAVFVDDGHVSEGSTSNLFAVIGGTLVTVPVGERVLPGITRAVLLELAADLDIPAEERALKHDDAFLADELFLTSTTREIAWVSKWNNQPVASGKCGPITQRLHRALREYIERDTAS